MRRLARGGDRAAAVAAFEAFRVALQEGLGMAPSAETRAGRGATHRRRQRRARDAGSAIAGRSHAHRAGAAGGPARVPRRAACAWRRASAGAASVVMVTGEAGSGKTRLLIELAGEAHADGATVLAGRCPEDGGVAFAPFIEALRRRWLRATARCRSGFSPS